MRTTMGPFADVLRDIKAEIARQATRQPGRSLLADRIEVRLPVARFARWAPVLDGIAEELGELVTDWAHRRGHGWHGGVGPRLQIVLVDGPEVTVEAAFSGSHGSGDTTRMDLRTVRRRG